MAYTGVYVFGDSLVDAGNALKLAKWYGNLTFSDLPEGAPSADQGYFQGRFSDGYNFADLLSNKHIGDVTKPVFPFGYEDPWLGFPVDPFASDPSGNNLNFAYGGAQLRQGDEVVPDFDGQTDAFKDAVDGDADPNALYLFTFGGNDVRNLAPAGSAPVARADAFAALDRAADKMLTELSQLVDTGVHNVLITGIADVGIIPNYDRDGNGVLEGAELVRSAAATEYSQYLDMLIRTEVVPALEALGADVTYVPLMDYVDSNGNLVTGALNANLPTIAALHGLTTEELSNNLLQYQDLIFVDQIHPNAQANALLGAYINAQLTGTPWTETLPLTGADVDYRLVSNIAVVGEVDTLIVSLVAGTTYTFEMLGMSSLGTPGSLGDPALRLLGPSGTLFGGDDDSGAGFDSTLTFTAATTGNYTIEFDAVGSLTGAYAFQAAVVGGAAMEAGNTYVVDSASTLVLEGAGGIGVDVVKASLSYTLSAGSEIEVLRTTNDKGKSAINLTGNEFGQTIVGNAGGNIIEGKAGADVLTGGAGKDIFVLSNAAVTDPGAANIDRITDYSSGDVVDTTQILKVAANTNVVAEGYLRVTTTGLVQVDVSGGGNDWVTLSTINGSGPVSVRYVSGGVVTSVSVPRVADSQQMAMTSANTNVALVSAVAAAGMMAVPAAAETRAVADEVSSVLNTVGHAQIGIDGTESFGSGAYRWALAGETREAVDGSAVAYSGNMGGNAAPRQFERASLAATEQASADSPAELLKGTAAVHGDVSGFASPVADAVAMPSAEMLDALVAGSRTDGHGSLANPQAAQTTAEVARVIADSLVESGGAKNLDALLDALPGGAHNPGSALETMAGHAAAATLALWDVGSFGAIGLANSALTMEMLAVHQDFMPAA